MTKYAVSEGHSRISEFACLLRAFTNRKSCAETKVGRIDPIAKFFQSFSWSRLPTGGGGNRYEHGVLRSGVSRMANQGWRVREMTPPSACHKTNDATGP